jgi:hypothetical protein
MPDTQKSLSELQTILANNTNKMISPQDIRDWLVSCHLKQITTTAVNYSATANDVSIILDASTAAISLTLPTCTAGNSGQMYSIKAIKAGTNKPYISNNIDGAAWTFQSSFDAIDICSDGTNWNVVGAYLQPIMKHTSPATINFTTTGTITAVNEVINISRNAILNVDFSTSFRGLTYTAGDYQAWGKLKINGTTKDENVIYFNLNTNTSFGYPMFLRAIATIPAGTNSITVEIYNANKFTIPGSATAFRYEINF